MVPMLNAWIFITNKHDSNALLTTLRQCTGNARAYSALTFIISEHNSDVQIRNNSLNLLHVYYTFRFLSISFYQLFESVVTHGSK